MIAARAAEAAALGAVLGGLTAACLMAAWIVVEAALLPALLAAAAPFSGGLLIVVLGRHRRLPTGMFRLPAWVPVAAGLAGLTMLLGGWHQAIGKNAFLLIVPLAAALAAGAAVATRLALRRVALVADKQADLRERLTTALEVDAVGAAGAFGRAVRRQAVELADRQRLGRVRFWTYSRRLAGAVVLAVAMPLLLVPIRPLTSPAAAQARQWQAAAPAAGKDLERTLNELDAASLAREKGLAEAIRQVERLAAAFRAGRAEDASDWRGRTIQLGQLAQTLREVARSGELDAAAAARALRLVRTLEEVAAELAAGMGENPRRYGLQSPSLPPIAATAQTRPAVEAVRVFNPSLTGTAGAADDGATVRGGWLVSYDAAWLRARAAAAQALADQAVPARHRRVVRDYFRADEAPAPVTP